MWAKVSYNEGGKLYTYEIPDGMLVRLFDIVEVPVGKANALRHAKVEAFTAIKPDFPCKQISGVLERGDSSETQPSSADCHPDAEAPGAEHDEPLGPWPIGEDPNVKP